MNATAATRPEIAIVVPMYNEAGNVAPLVAELVRIFEAGASVDKGVRRMLGFH